MLFQNVRERETDERAALSPFSHSLTLARPTEALNEVVETPIITYSNVTGVVFNVTQIVNDPAFFVAKGMFTLSTIVGSCQFWAFGIALTVFRIAKLSVLGNINKKAQKGGAPPLALVIMCVIIFIIGAISMGLMFMEACLEIAKEKVSLVNKGTRAAIVGQFRVLDLKEEVVVEEGGEGEEEEEEEGKKERALTLKNDLHY